MQFVPGPEGCEVIDNYQPGGYHPVTIGDEFDEGRYRILHKLGAGGFATVWLARDNQTEFNVALKVCMADSSEWSNEVKVFNHLDDTREDNGKDSSYLARLLDAFWHEGPNGCHRIIVTEIGGPSLASLRNKMKIRPDMVRDLARQLLEGLQEMHEAGVVYGDFTPANVLIRPIGIDTMSEEELYSRFGHPVPIEVRVLDEEAVLDEHVPTYVYDTIDIGAMKIDTIEEPQVMMIDFGESYILDDEEKSEEFGNNLSYASPETIVMDERGTQASDIWALACIMFEMRAGKQLFPDRGQSAELINGDMIRTIGFMPETYLKKVMGDDYVSPDKRAPRPAVTSEPPSNSGRLGTAWNWVLSFLQTSKEDTHRVEKPNNPKSLAGRIGQIGEWNKWCTMTRRERITAYKKYLRSAGERNPEVPEEILYNNGHPPPRLSPLEQKDFTNLLSSILKWLPEERPTLEEIEKHPYFRRQYLATCDMTRPWLETFHWGMKLSAERNGKVTVFC